MHSRKKCLTKKITLSAVKKWNEKKKFHVRVERKKFPPVVFSSFYFLNTDLFLGKNTKGSTINAAKKNHPDLHTRWEKEWRLFSSVSPFSLIFSSFKRGIGKEKNHHLTFLMRKRVLFFEMGIRHNTVIKKKSFLCIIFSFFIVLHLHSNNCRRSEDS